MKKSAILIICSLLLPGGNAFAQYVDDSVYGSSNPYGDSDPYKSENPAGNDTTASGSDDMNMSNLVDTLYRKAPV